MFYSKIINKADKILPIRKGIAADFHLIFITLTFMSHPKRR